MAEGKFYVVGLKGSGVLFVKTSPFRAAIVTDAEIKRYNSSGGGVDGYARIAAAACAMIAEHDPEWKLPIDMTYAKGIESLVASGVKLCLADFALVADVVDEKWSARRSIVMPIEHALSIIASDSGSAEPGGATLREAVLNDSPSPGR